MWWWLLGCAAQVAEPVPAPPAAVEVTPSVGTLPVNALRFEVVPAAPEAPGRYAFGLDHGTIAREVWHGAPGSLALADAVTLELDGLDPGATATLQVFDGDAVIAVRRFRVAPADHHAPDASRWVWTVGAAGTAAPLRVGFDEPMARGTVDVLEVIVGGARVDGAWALDASQRVATFTPAAPWTDAGVYVAVGAGAADLAGNAAASRPEGPIAVPR